MSGYTLNPLLPYKLQHIPDFAFEIKDEEGHVVDIIESFNKVYEALNAKVDKDQGAANRNKVLITDSQGHVALSNQYLMTADERAKLRKITEDKFITVEEREKLAHISNVLIFKDVLMSESQLISISDKTVGDVYYVTSLDAAGKVSYTQYVWTGSRWAVLGTSGEHSALKEGAHIAIDSESKINAHNLIPQYESFDNIPDNETIIQYTGDTKGNKVHGFFYEKDETVIDHDPEIEMHEVVKTVKYTIPKGYNAAIVNEGSNLIPPGIYLNDKTSRTDANFYSTFKNVNSPYDQRTWMNINFFDDVYNKIGEDVYAAWTGTPTGDNYKKVRVYDKSSKRLYLDDGSVYQHVADTVSYITVWPCHKLNSDGSIDSAEYLLYQPGASQCWFWKSQCRYNNGYTHAVTDYINNEQRHYQWKTNYYVDTPYIATEKTYVRTEIPKYEVIVDWVQRDVQPRDSADVSKVEARVDALEDGLKWEIIE